ncbi:MAG: SUMF1/EgtB/PvdO family nonheme iron enzyme, partial [Anaerolineae bacterium]|nr:SUMF1/EgtB/PvdO family nonheme iron enzyme [Anaerolineae bacterium]
QKDITDGVKTSLGLEGYRVISAKNGKDALDMLEKVTPDLILADIMMPEMDGYELYKRVNQDARFVQIPFIFVTAKTGQEDIRKGKFMGVDDYLTKPFDPDDLLAAVQGRIQRLDVIKEAAGPRKLFIPQVVAGILVLVGIITAAYLLFFTDPAPDEILVPPAAAAVSDLDIGAMVTVPGGEFIMGDSTSGNNEQLNLAEFQIDKYEVVNAQYKAFVDETGRAAPWEMYPEAEADYPVTNVSWEDAAAFCAWAGKRLPTEAEWEKAARGSEGNIYPWGNEWQAGFANTEEGGDSGLQPVGRFAEGASPYGALDMAGNAAEWVEDWFDSAQENKVIRGGSANAVKKWAATFERNQVPPGFTQEMIGFRCAR